MTLSYFLLFLFSHALPRLFSLLAIFHIFSREPNNTAPATGVVARNVLAFRNHWLHANRFIGEWILCSPE